jgi:CHAT domain-containing protein/lipopolysaccharide biosynthesis regulator YciM
VKAPVVLKKRVIEPICVPFTAADGEDEMMPSKWTSVPATLLVMLLLATTCPPSSAQQADLGAYVKRYDELFQAGNYDAALGEARKFEAAARARYGTQHESYAGALYLEARALYVLGKYPEAEKLYKLALPIFEKAKPSAASTRDLAKTLNGLGRVYEHEGRYAEAETFQKRALSVVESSPDSDQMVVSYALEDLGNAYFGEGRYAEAEDYYKRTLAIREKAPGGDRGAVSQTLNLISNVYTRTGRFAEAEPLLKRAVDIQEKVFGPNHPDVAKSLTNLAELYRLTGRYALAEPLQRRALEIQEKALGTEHPHVGVTLNNLALTYWNWGRYADAEPLYRRSVEVQEKALGKEHPQVALSLNNLGLAYMRLGRYAEAEPVLKRALAIREKVLPKDHPDIGQSLGNLAAAYRYAGKPAEGLPLLQRAIAIMEKNYGPDHLSVTYSLTATANADVALKRYAEGEPFARRSLAIRQKALGADHTDVASVLKTLAQVNLGTNRILPAADFSRQAVQVAIRALKNGDITTLGFDVASLREYFDVHLAILYRAVADGVAGGDAVAESFEIAQWANQSAAATALNRMAARTGAGSGALAALVRKQQDDAAELRSLDKSLLTEVSKRADQRDPKREQLVRQHRKELEDELMRSSTQISTEFPDYADLVSPKPLSLVEAQKLIAAGEALVLFHVSDMGNYVWAITPDRIVWRKINLSRAELNDAVQKLRASVEKVEMPERSLARAFDLELAHSLYSALLGPVEPVLSSKPHLMVVPSGALTSLPLHLLLTDKPAQKPSVRDWYSAYRSAPWLMRRHAVTVLPSVPSLKVRAASFAAPQPYLGFGDPLTQGRSIGPRPRGAQPATVTYRRLFREGHVDIASLREIERLPESADELREIAKVFDVAPTVVKIENDATERAVKTIKLDDYRIVHFATHALVAGETARYSDMAEPALVFTPPQVPSDIDDGLLTSSEIASLKLNADWVILSACNTADGDKPGAEALSGLARAFFYAGAKTLLVSNWYLDSKAAVQLTTRTVQAMEQEKTMLPAEALRRAMLELVDSPKNIDDPYPGVWAPFMVVGLTQRTSN